MGRMPRTAARSTATWGTPYEAGTPRAGVRGGSGRTGCLAPTDSESDSSDEGGEGEEADEEQ